MDYPPFIVIGKKNINSIEKNQIEELTNVAKCIYFTTF
jgi:hypothetical protein